MAWVFWRWAKYHGCIFTWTPCNLITFGSLFMTCKCTILFNWRFWSQMKNVLHLNCFLPQKLYHWRIISTKKYKKSRIWLSWYCKYVDQTPYIYMLTVCSLNNKCFERCKNYSEFTCLISSLFNIKVIL